MSSTRHVLVTGGAGFIGSHLVERLLGEGARVTIIDDCSTGSLANLASLRSREKVKVIHSKVSGCPSLQELCASADLIYHLAAAVGVELVVNSPIRTIETNLRETEVILEHASASRTPILIASTSEVYGKSQKEAFSEEDDLVIGPPHLGRWSYACSKLMDEFLGLAFARERKLPVVIARLFNTVGPRQTGQYGMVLPRFIQAALENKPLRVFGTGEQTRCFCYVGDTVEALLRLGSCEAARGQVVNVGTSEEVTIKQLAEKVIALLGSSSRIEYIPYDRAYQPGFDDMLRRKPVVEKLASLTGFRASTRLDEIIALTARAAGVPMKCVDRNVLR